ncbi:hypothetical protein CsSME_00028375 [Camellia sinensis var. sinensis]
MLEKLQYQNNKKVGFIVEDNDVSVEPNIDARLSNVEKEVKDLRGDLNNLVVGVNQSIESAKEEILIAIAKVANGSWPIEKEKHSYDIDCQLKNEDTWMTNGVPHLMLSKIVRLLWINNSNKKMRDCLRLH